MRLKSGCSSIDQAISAISLSSVIEARQRRRRWNAGRVSGDGGRRVLNARADARLSRITAASAGALCALGGKTHQRVAKDMAQRISAHNAWFAFSPHRNLLRGACRAALLRICAHLFLKTLALRRCHLHACHLALRCLPATLRFLLLLPMASVGDDSGGRQVDQDV